MKFANLRNLLGYTFGRRAHQMVKIAASNKSSLAFTAYPWRYLEPYCDVDSTMDSMETRKKISLSGAETRNIIEYWNVLSERNT